MTFELENTNVFSCVAQRLGIRIGTNGTKALSRDKFSKEVRDTLARRVANLCSNPDCRAPTSGPSFTDSRKGVNVGVAAHITAAAPGGPRYDGSITKAQRESAENGIWLCQTCSSLIDKNGGADYSTTTLLAWKVDAEVQASQRIGKTASLSLSSINARVQVTGVGELTGVEITKPTRIEAGTHITANGFGKITGIRSS